MPLRHPELFSDMSKWIHAQPGIQPRDGCNVLDIDFVVHKFARRTQGGKCREKQLMMFLETKEHAAELRPNQRDTLYQVHQLLTTRVFHWQVVGSDGRYKKGHPQNSRRVKALVAGKVVDLKCYGCFFLKLSKTDPDNSDWMEWSHGPDWKGRRITREDLGKLLRFQIDPVSFRADDPARSHHKEPTYPLYSIAER